MQNSNYQNMSKTILKIPLMNLKTKMRVMNLKIIFPKNIEKNHSKMLFQLIYQIIS